MRPIKQPLNKQFGVMAGERLRLDVFNKLKIRSSIEVYRLESTTNVKLPNRCRQVLEKVPTKNFEIVPNFGNYTENKVMGRNTSISLGDYFEDFVRNQTTTGRYKNASEVIRAGLRLLEERENKIKVLRYEIQKGLDSGIAEDFNPDEFLKKLKAKKHRNG